MKKKELIVIMTIMFIFLIGLLGETHLVKYIPESLIIRNYELSELTMIIFQVYATIATLGIAIIAIISGTNNNSIYGIPVSKYILNIKPKLLKHLRVIIFILLSTLAAYFLSVFGNYNLLISLFVITIILLSTLFYETSIIFNGNKYLEDEILSYIMEEYQNKDVLSYLTKDTVDSIEKFDSNRYRLNSKALLKIFTTVSILFEKKNTEMIRFWESELNDIFRNSFKNFKAENLILTFKSLNDFYYITHTSHFKKCL